MFRINSAIQGIATDQASVAATLNTLIQSTPGNILETRVIRFGANQFLCVLIVQTESYVDWFHIALVDTIALKREVFRVFGDVLPLVDSLTKALSGRELDVETLSLTDEDVTKDVTSSGADILALVDPALTAVIDVGRTPTEVFELVEEFARKIEIKRSPETDQIYIDDICTAIKNP